MSTERSKAPATVAPRGIPGRLSRWLPAHRIAMLSIGLAVLAWCASSLRWDWIPEYSDLALQGLWRTVWLLLGSCTLGFLLAVPLGLAQAAGPWYVAVPARWFCTVIRGTPLLLQIWLLYYGLGSLFPQFPAIRDSQWWPILREAWPCALLALSLSYAGYEGEVMRGAFRNVAPGQLEAGRAFGMRRRTLFRRIWLPQAIRNAVPTLAGETVLQMKATPLVATITLVDLYAVAGRVRQDTFIVYEPLLLLAVAYMAIAGLITWLFGLLERRVP